MPNPDDDELFLDAMRGVEALADRERVPAAGSGKPAAKPAARAAPALEVDGASGRARGVSERQLAELRGGRLPVGRRIDLHGLRVEPARHAIARDLARAAADGVKCVLVVHGKGTHSGGAGVLGEVAIDALARGPSARHVLGFCPALPRDGGDGALYVLVRRPRRPR